MNIQSIKNDSYIQKYQRKISLKTKPEEICSNGKKFDKLQSPQLMSTLSTSGNQSSLSFGQKHLYSIKLKKRKTDGSYEFIPAYFSKLTPKKEEDRYFMEKLEGFWSPQRDRNMAGDIAEDFFSSKKGKENNFYIIEKNDDEYYVDTFCKTTSVVETTNPKSEDKSKFEIKYLQTNPDIIHADTQEIKGSGELMIYGCIKEAKKHGFDKVEIYSTNNNFYKHLGMVERPQANYFTIDSSEYNDFLRKTEKKYNIK